MHNAVPKNVIYRDRQELQPNDLLNQQGNAAEALGDVVYDAISSTRHFVGLDVAQISANEVTVAPGRLYNGGNVYLEAQEQTQALMQYMPVASKKIVVLAAGGDVVEHNVEPRDFLIDLDTGTTEPQSVPMEELQKCTISVVPGEESVAPQVPTVSSALLPFAYVYMSTTGIDSIEMIDDNRLPNLRLVDGRLVLMERWRDQAESQISGIGSDLASLTDKTSGKVDRRQYLQLAGDMARLKDRMNIPDTAVDYAADFFNDDTETDTGGAGYAARIDLGCLFPFADSAQYPLALFNPVDPSVRQTADNVVMPDYDDVLRVKTEGYAGSKSISQYQSQSHTLRSYTAAEMRTHYGQNMNWVNAWQNVRYTDVTGTDIGAAGLVRSLYNRILQIIPGSAYKLETSTTSVNGALLAQTYLSPATMWVTKLGFYLTDIGAAGDLQLVLTETVGGKPDLEKALATVTIAQADLVKYPSENRVPISPVRVEAGKRYAVVMITQGDHHAAMVSGSQIGTLFTSTDGSYMEADLTQDLMFNIYSAQFKRVRTEVQLGQVDLAGGMTDIDIRAQSVVPDGCELSYEIQIGGRWYRMDDSIDHLASAPNLVPLRAVFLGTRDLAPLIKLAADAITVSRPDVTQVHWSTVRNLSAASEDITVQLVFGSYDSVNHTVAVQLVDGANTYDAVSSSEQVEDDDSHRLTFSFTPEVGTGITSYQIKTTTTRAPASRPPALVERTDVAL